MSSCCSYSAACYIGGIPPRKKYLRDNSNYHGENLNYHGTCFSYIRRGYSFAQKAPSELAMITASTVAVIAQYSQSRSRAKSRSDITTRIIGVKINASTPS